MKLAVKMIHTQPQKNYQLLVESVISHLQAAAQITKIKDLRYFSLHDLQMVRINLHLALELLAVIQKEHSLKIIVSLSD